MHPDRYESLRLAIRVQNVRMPGRMKIQTAAYTNVCEDLNFYPDNADGRYGRESLKEEKA
jgi:hypothetical protein